MRTVRQIRTFQDLISTLEPVEESELQSDIRENAYFELKRIRRNISAVLSFLHHSMLPMNPEARAVAEEVRQECLLINRMVSRALLFHVVPGLPQQLLMKRVAVLGLSYQELAVSIHRLCLWASPDLASDLASALQTPD